MQDEVEYTLLFDHNEMSLSLVQLQFSGTHDKI
jgi:hypothetical protein